MIPIRNHADRQEYLKIGAKATNRRLPIEEGTEACIEAVLLAMDEEGCATLEDFKFEFRSRDKMPPRKVIYDLLLEMEKRKLVERRYSNFSLREIPSSHMWIRLDDDKKPVLPHFYTPDVKMNPMERAALYYGGNS